MQPDDRIRIRHMLDAAETAINFISGKSRADLDTDKMLLFALVRAVEIIGEAATRVSEPARTSVNAVPWALIVAMRHRLIHAYFDINRDILWTTVPDSGILRICYLMIPCAFAYPSRGY